MNIENAQYTADGSIKVTADGKTYFLPDDPANRYYKLLVEEGVVINPYSPPPPPTAEEMEDEVQDQVKNLTDDNDMFVAMGVATVRLVLAAVKGQIPSSATEAQVVSRYRDEVVAILRARKGI